MLHSLLRLIPLTGQDLNGVRVGHPVFQIQHTFLALLVYNIPHRRLILETERAKPDTELRA